MDKKFLFFFILLNLSVHSQDSGLDLFDEKDIEVLKEESPENFDFQISEKEELDDLESIKNDIEEVYFEDEKDEKLDKVTNDFLKELEFENLEKKKEEAQKEIKKNISERTNPEEVSESKGSSNDIVISEIDTGAEEEELLEFAQKLGNKIPNNEWMEIKKNANVDTYKVNDGDTLWRISKRLFGTGFFYSKVWSLNPYIKNPHQIEPGMVLAFTTGTENDAPEIRLGTFDLETASDANPGPLVNSENAGMVWSDLSQFAEDSTPAWLVERERLMQNGVFVQNASEYTYQDLKAISSQKLVKEYENYDPPENAINIKIPETYDDVGFDRTSIVRREFRQGFYLNTFVTSNIVQDLGEVESGREYNYLLDQYNHVFIRFDEGLNISPGDKFSIYSAEGRVSHDISEREGYRYTIKGQLKVLSENSGLWRCELFDVSGEVRRGDRITVYTPKIQSLLKTFNQRKVEAAIIGSYDKEKSIYGFGDVIYLDRGRADGLEIGNVLEVYSFSDRNTDRRIAPEPAYKIGELNLISITDNFSTALVSLSSFDIQQGQLAITKTLENAMRENKILTGESLKAVKEIEENALEELDVELNLDDVNKDILKELDKKDLTDDELDELERQEKEKSILKDHEQDLKDLDRLEKDIEAAEGLLNELVEDQDQLLEQEDLENIEDELKRPDPDAFESLDEIEQEIGKKYMDEDLNAKENPYGLTEFDLEEIDELLNTDEELNPN